jgi:peptidase E
MDKQIDLAQADNESSFLRDLLDNEVILIGGGEAVGTTTKHQKRAPIMDKQIDLAQADNESSFLRDLLDNEVILIGGGEAVGTTY